MQTLSNKELVGYVELQVGSLKVEVPIRAASQGSPTEPLAKFETEGNTFFLVEVMRALFNGDERKVDELDRRTRVPRP